MTCGTRFARHTAASLVSGLASLRPRPGNVVGYATRIALRELGRRAEFLDAQLERLDELIAPLVAARAPGLLALHGVGPDTAALLLVAAGDHPERLRSEAAWAHLCAVAPLQASSGKVTRYRLNPGGDRQASHALWRIVLTRMAPIRRLSSTSSGAPRKASRRRDHPLPEALRRPRGLPPPPRAARLTLTLRGRPDPQIGCRTRAGLLTIRRPSPGSLSCLAGRDLIRAFPHPSGPSLSCPQPQQNTLLTILQNPRNEIRKMSRESLDEA